MLRKFIKKWSQSVWLLRDSYVTDCTFAVSRPNRRDRDDGKIHCERVERFARFRQALSIVKQVSPAFGRTFSMIIERPNRRGNAFPRMVRASSGNPSTLGVGNSRPGNSFVRARTSRSSLFYPPRIRVVWLPKISGVNWNLPHRAAVKFAPRIDTKEGHCAA